MSLSRAPADNESAPLVSRNPKPVLGLAMSVAADLSNFDHASKGVSGSTVAFAARTARVARRYGIFDPFKRLHGNETPGAGLGWLCVAQLWLAMEDSSGLNQTSRVSGLCAKRACHIPGNTRASWVPHPCLLTSGNQEFCTGKATAALSLLIRHCPRRIVAVV